MLGDRVVVLSGAPSTVIEVADVRDLGPPDAPEYGAMRLRLRNLLAIDQEEVSPDGDGGE